MQKFVDSRGRVWVVEISTATIKRVRALTGVNLYEVVDGDLMEKLEADIVLFCDLLYAICKPQADRDRVSDEQFGEGLAGDVIDEATTAFIEAMLQFLPERHRHRTRRAVAKYQRTQDRLNQMIVTKLDDEEIETRLLQKVEREIDDRLQRLESSDFFTSSPGLSASTLVP
jgi:hypothetical protein